MSLQNLHTLSITGTAYFASDFHFGAPNRQESADREAAIIRWLDQIKEDADYLFLLGDIFDFWFEYKDVVPKGNFSFLAKLAELRAQGITIYYFTGNHDMWVGDYFQEELGVQLFRAQQSFCINGRQCLVGHGDGLDPADKGYRLLKRIFAFRPNQIAYGLLPPRCAFALARFFSRNSRAMNNKRRAEQYADGDSMVPYMRTVADKEPIDYFIYGHRHVPVSMPIGERAIYLNTGDWLTHRTFVRWKKAESPELLYFTEENGCKNSGQEKRSMEDKIL